MQEQPFEIRRYWALFQKRKYIAISFALAVISLFTWGSFFLSKTYEASSTVFIERSSVIDPLIRGVGVSSSMEDRLRNLKDGITSRNIIERVLKKIDMDTKAKDSGQYEALIENIRKNLDIKVKSARERETDLFIISYKGEDPKTVRDIVNTIVSEYIEENMSYKRKDAYGAYEFIEGQLLEYKKRLEESDSATREFREKNPYMVPQSETTLLTRLEGFQTAKIEAEIKLKELLRKKDNLQKQLSGEKELTVAFVTREGSPQARLNYLNNQLIQLMTRYTDEYPEVIRVKREIEELKKQISEAKDSHAESSGSETAAINPVYQQLKEELARTDSEIESLRARLAELSRQQQEAQGTLGRMPKEQEEWAKLQRDRNVYQRIYDDLLQKLENARVSKDLELTDKAATFRVVDPAIIPAQPIKPDRVRIILLGILLGLASGTGIVFGLEYFNNSYKDEDSIEAGLKLPVLASIPKIITEADELSEKRRDRKVFMASGAYLFIIGIVLIKEFLSRYMGINIINF
ncbi:MAG: XrtA system polysaccharide chain length determinant [Nitrospirota bacterium]